jgi:hypothetical protein
MPSCCTVDTPPERPRGIGQALLHEVLSRGTPA